MLLALIFLPTLRLPELDFGRVFGLGTENLSKLGILNGELGNNVNFG